MAVLLNNNCDAGNAEWMEILPRYLPDLPIYSYPDIPDPARIQYALVWNHPVGELKRYPNLRCILSLAAGMEHLLHDHELPNVPLVSLGDPAMSVEMANYAVYWTINAHRQLEQYRHQQQQQHWQRLMVTPIGEFNVLVLGLGRIATQVATTIQSCGYRVRAWDFNQKQAPSISTFHGETILPELLASSDVVISCLALNQRSHHLIDDQFIAAMPHHAQLINISRGDIIDERALLDALNHQIIDRAILDVVSVEPLPKQHPFWTHPRVTLTPHMAGPTPVDSASRIIAENILRMEKGMAPEPIFDRNRGFQA